MKLFESEGWKSFRLNSLAVILGVVITFGGGRLITNCQKRQDAREIVGFQLYLNNIKSLAMELLTYTDMVVFNRCTQETPIDTFNRSIKAVNRRAEVMFETKDGETLQPEDVLPYDRDHEKPINH